MWAAVLRFNFYTEGESSGFLVCVTPFSSYTVSWLALSKCLQTNSGLPCKIQVTVSNQSNHEVREAASSLQPISASVVQQSPGATLQPAGEGIFFLRWPLVQSHPIWWATLEQCAHETPLCTWFQKGYIVSKKYSNWRNVWLNNQEMAGTDHVSQYIIVILARIFEYNRLWRLLLKTYFTVLFYCFICIIFLWSHTFENRNLKHGLI